jgi:hypothetical protein
VARPSKDKAQRPTSKEKSLRYAYWRLYGPHPWIWQVRPAGGGREPEAAARRGNHDNAAQNVTGIDMGRPGGASGAGVIDAGDRWTSVARPFLNAAQDYLAQPRPPGPGPVDAAVTGPPPAGPGPPRRFRASCVSIGPSRELEPLLSETFVTSEPDVSVSRTAAPAGARPQPERLGVCLCQWACAAGRVAR